MGREGDGNVRIEEASYIFCNWLGERDKILGLYVCCDCIYIFSMRAYNIRFFCGSYYSPRWFTMQDEGRFACHDDAFRFGKLAANTDGRRGEQEHRMRRYSGMHPVILLSTYSEPRR